MHKNVKSSGGQFCNFFQLMTPPGIGTFRNWTPPGIGTDKFTNLQLLSTLCTVFEPTLGGVHFEADLVKTHYNYR